MCRRARRQRSQSPILVTVRIDKHFCQQLHIQLDSTQELQQNTVLSLDLPSGCPVLMIHGSCHSHSKAGGAGVAALQVTADDTFLTHWSSNTPFKRSLSKGIFPLINHMNYKGRIRRIEIAQIMEECQLLASQLSDLIQFEYLPRECNCLADYFAGFASAFQLSQPLDTTTSIVAPLPYSLLHTHGFKVDHAEADIALTLNEQRQFCWIALTQYLQRNSHCSSVTSVHARFSQSHLTVHCDLPTPRH